jgi:hypothetical protein
MPIRAIFNLIPSTFNPDCGVDAYRIIWVERKSSHNALMFKPFIIFCSILYTTYKRWEMKSSLRERAIFISTPRAEGKMDNDYDTAYFVIHQLI